MSMRLGFITQLIAICFCIVAMSACSQIEQLKNKKNGGKETAAPVDPKPADPKPEPAPAPEPSPTPDPTPTPEPEPAPAPTPTPDPTPTPTPIPKNCELTSADDVVDPLCLEGSIRLNGFLLAGAVVDRREATITVSIKNGGKNGSKFFDHLLRFEGETNVKIPEEIPAQGKPGTGHKLYASFGNATECAWMSKSNRRFKEPRCFEGAERDPESKDGFKGGHEVSHDEIPHADFVHLTIDSADGNDALTTAVFKAEW